MHGWIRYLHCLPIKTGGIDNLATDSWAVIITTNASAARSRPTAVWTGSKMLVWGGSGHNTGSLNTGGIYEP